MGGVRADDGKESGARPSDRSAVWHKSSKVLASMLAAVSRLDIVLVLWGALAPGGCWSTRRKFRAREATEDCGVIFPTQHGEIKKAAPCCRAAQRT